MAHKLITQNDDKKEPKMIWPCESNTGFKTTTWNDFWATGIPGYINLILLPFGWQIIAIKNDQGQITNVCPARTRLRDVDGDTATKNMKRMNAYMRTNADILYDESHANGLDLEDVIMCDPDSGALEIPDIILDE